MPNDSQPPSLTIRDHPSRAPLPRARDGSPGNHEWKRPTSDDERILFVIRDHPWCDAWQVAGLSGISLRTTYRRLEMLKRQRMVWSVRVGVPDVRGDLYALGREGLIYLAGGPQVAVAYARALGLDPMGLGRALMRVRALSWTRNLLVSLLDQGQDLAWVVSPARVAVGSRSLVLDAHGVAIPWPGRYIIFGVFADTGGISVAGWVGRLQLFMSWAEEQVRRGWAKPALVFLTTYNARAMQLVALWHELHAWRRGEEQAHLFVAAVNELGERGTAWVSADGSQLYLWEGMHGDSEPLPRSWPEIDSWKGGGGESLGACMLQGTLGGNRVLRAFQNLSPIDWRVLDAIASWPLLRSVEIAALLGQQAGQIARSTRRLLELGVVEVARLSERKDEERLHLSPSGISLLAATHGMRARRFGRARHWPVGQDGPVRLHLGAYQYAVKHTLLAIEFMIGLRRLADWWWEAGYFHRLVIWDSVECVRQYIDALGRRRFLVPDSGGAYQIGQEVYPFLLEIDRDRGHRDKLVGKLRHYYDSRRYPDALEIGPMPRLLILSATEGRARQVNEVLVGLARERGEPVLDAAITTLERVRFPGRLNEIDGRVERIEREGPGRPIEPSIWPGLREWRLAGESFDSLTWCFPALAPDARYEALRPMDLTALDKEVQRKMRAQRAQRERRQREREQAARENKERK